MTAPPAPLQSTLFAQRSGFLRDVTRWNCGCPENWPENWPEIIALKARFIPSAFDPALFATFGVCCPPALASVPHARQAEFLAGRTLARVALARLGRTDAQIPIGADRAPDWPEGFHGSLSHKIPAGQTDGYCLVLATGPRLKSKPLIGLDAEGYAAGRALQAIRSKALGPQEHQLIATQTDLPKDVLATLIFSAKESLFKALYPDVQRIFGFSAARCISLCPRGPSRGSLCLQLNSTLSTEARKGRIYTLVYQLDKTHLVTWICGATGSPLPRT